MKMLNKDPKKRLSAEDVLSTLKEVEKNLKGEKDD